MTLQEIKDSIEQISLKHKSINDFDYGEDYLLSTGKGNDYPLAFLEIPYSLSYDLNDTRFKSFTFALLILMTPTQDDVVEDHSLISQAETIVDAILTKAQKELKSQGVVFESISGISLREFSDDNVSGFRFDITIKTFREYCNHNYQDQFEA